MTVTKTAVAFALGLSIIASAQANDINKDYGVITAPNQYTDILVHGVGTFTDTLNFTIITDTFAEGALSNVRFSTLFDIAGLSVGLYDGSDVLIDNLDDNVGSTADQKLGSGLYAPGNYYFKVQGNAVGTFGGQYVFNAVTAVPEPERVAMLLAGMGLLGAMARRQIKR